MPLNHFKWIKQRRVFLSANHFKRGSNFIISYIRRIFNKIYSSGVFPEQWSTSLLIPVHKKGPRDIPDNYYCFCIVLCVGFCTGHFVMVPLILTYLHCLQQSLNISSIDIITYVFWNKLYDRCVSIIKHIFQYADNGCHSLGGSIEKQINKPMHVYTLLHFYFFSIIRCSSLPSV